MTRRCRLDSEMVRRGLAGDPESARQLVADGRVMVDGAPALKPSRLVAGHESISLGKVATDFVSRGGQKLAAALDHFGIICDGVRVVDAGASTGGFTDCVLQHGAAEVHSVDVGYGQLDHRLRQDPRVVVHERTNIRSVTAESIGGAADLVVADLSFVSVASDAACLIALTDSGGSLVVLVKPQFEVEPGSAAEGRGVITDPELWRASLNAVIATFEAAGADMMGSMVSPLHGADGNTEFLVHLTPRRPVTAGDS